ncbi:hypothetical protein LCGC14_1944900, partial [marine sediment metagenome]
MNKYRGMNPQLALPSPQAPIPVRGRLDRGIVLFRPPQDIELSMSPELDCVRVIEGGLRQDFALTELSTATALAILALGEHRFVVTGSEMFESTFRFLEKASSLIKIESWNGLTWDTEIDTDDWIVEAVLLSYKSYFSTAFFADGKRVLKWIQTTSFVAQSDEFTSGNALVAVDDTVNAAIVPAASINGEYDVHYSVDVDGPCAAGSYVDVSILDDGTIEIATVRHSIPADTSTSRSYTLPHEIAAVIDSIASGENLTLKLKAINAVAVSRSNDLSGTSVDVSFTKVEAREAVSDLYTFSGFDLNYIGGGSETGDTNLEFYYDTGAGCVLWNATTAYTEASSVGAEKVLTQAGLGATDKFRILIPAGDQGNYEFAATASIAWGESFVEEVSIKGFNLASDGDPSEGVTYQTAGTPVNELREVDQDPAVTPKI